MSKKPLLNPDHEFTAKELAEELQKDDSFKKFLVQHPLLQEGIKPYLLAMSWMGPTTLVPDRLYGDAVPLSRVLRRLAMYIEKWDGDSATQFKKTITKLIKVQLPERKPHTTTGKTRNPYDLKTLSTRELMKYYRMGLVHLSYISNEYGSVVDSGEDPRIWVEDLLNPSVGRKYTIQEIKAELNTREHIPNKKEGSLARRAKAKAPVDKTVRKVRPRA